GRLREIARGPARHGTCGVGIGEAVRDVLAHPDEVVRGGDLRELSRLEALASRARERLRAEGDALPLARTAPEVARERFVFEDSGLPAAWARAAARVAGCVVDDEVVLTRWGGDSSALVFEGAQGVLLDQDHGFHPYTTWSRCTAAGALELVREHL